MRSQTDLKLVSMLVLLVAAQLYLPTARSFLLHVQRHHNNNNRFFHQKSGVVSSFLDQRLDHFNPQDNQTFQQRYYESLEYFEDPHGPIFLEICGESKCYGIDDDFYMVLAQEMKAAVVKLEHRYYGESIPVPDLQTKNFKYLSTQQALFDLATFRNYYQVHIKEKHNLSTSFENPWIVLGGSYAGALSAWFRVKFPHLVRGSISSSGVINSIKNFQAYDLQVGESLGPLCGAAYRNITKRLEEGLVQNATATKSLFNATELNIDGDFASFIGAYPSSYVQYGDPTTPCKSILEALKNGTDILEAFINDVNASTFGDLPLYNQEILKDTNATADVGRQWAYQTCSELGYFATAASENNTFMHQLDLKYYLDLCANVFGDGTYPTTDVTNLDYGATSISGSRILFLNGSQDPYRHASRSTSTPSEESILITCNNCAHRVDIAGCPPYLPGGDPSSCASPENVTHARDVMRSSIKKWIID